MSSAQGSAGKHGATARSSDGGGRGAGSAAGKHGATARSSDGGGRGAGSAVGKHGATARSSDGGGRGAGMKHETGSRDSGAAAVGGGAAASRGTPGTSATSSAPQQQQAGHHHRETHTKNTNKPARADGAGGGGGGGGGGSGRGQKRPRVHSASPAARSAAADTAASLPIAAYRAAIVDAVRSAPVTVLVGETGSGKTTQVPQFLFAAGLTAGGTKQIIVTQPRRVAAITVARRVAAEMGAVIGSGREAGLVGYSVRFDDATGHATRIKFATDGMLLR
jgi:hypothetical protein